MDDLKSKAPKGGKKAAKHKKKVKAEEKQINNRNVDYEMFLQDLEEDKGKVLFIQSYRYESTSADLQR